MASLLFIDVPASILTLVRDDLHVLAAPSGPGMKVYVNENERITHCRISHGRRTGEAADGGAWDSIVEAINIETFSDGYYGNTDNDRKEKKIETEWIDMDTTPESLEAQSVTRALAQWFAVRWVEMRGRSPVMFEFTADLRYHTFQIGSVVTVSTADWQDVHGEKRPEPARFVRRVDKGDGKIEFEAQGLNLSGLDTSTGAMVPRRWAWIAPDHVGATYDTASIDDRQYCYLSGSDGKVGAGSNEGYRLP